MSEVWTAMDEDGADDEVIALKIFSNNADKNSLRNEYALMRKFNHPNLLRPDYFGVDNATDAPFMLMKYYSKGSVSNIVNNSEIDIKSISEKLIAEFILSATRALVAIQNHDSKIIHQDIKPDNFLINDDGSFILADFGVSTVSKATIHKINGNGLAGVPAYAAPERFKGAPPRFSQDIFSLGVTIYEILTGVLPFQDFGGQRLNQGFPVPDLDAAFGYSSRLNSLCKRCMDLEPDARPLSTELLDWAEFYLKNEHWPEIPFVDVAAIKAEKLFQSSKLVYDRIVGSKLNEIDKVELENCIKNYKEVLKTNIQKLEINEQVEVLINIYGELDQFKLLENKLFEYKSLTSVGQEDIENLKSEFTLIKSKISPSYYGQIIEQIDSLISIKKESTIVFEQLTQLLKKSIYELDIKYAQAFVLQNKISEKSLTDLIYQLENNIDRSKSFQDLKQDCDIEIQKPIHLVEIHKIEQCTERLKEHIHFLGSSYFSNIEKKVERSRLYNTLNDEYLSIDHELEKENLSASNLNEILIQLNILISQSLKLQEGAQSDWVLVEQYNLFENLKKNIEERVKKTPTAIELLLEADNSFRIVELYIEKKKFTTQTLKEHLKIIEEAIGKYSKELSTKPNIIQQKIIKSDALKHIIVEELRKKRRGLAFWFLKGAAVFGIIIFLILYLKKSGNSEGEFPEAGKGQVEVAGGSKDVVTGENKEVIEGGKKEVIEEGNKDLVTEGNNEMVTGGNKDVDAEGNKEEVAGGNKEVVAGGNKEEVAGGNKEIVVGGNKEVVTVGNKEVIEGGNKELVAGGNSAQSNNGKDKQEITSSCAPQILQNKSYYIISKKDIVLTCESPCGGGDFYYEWKMNRGENCKISGQNTNTLIISNYKIGDYEFRLVKKKNGDEISAPIYYTFKVAF